MGGGTDKIVFQRKHTNDQKVHEKMINITKQQIDANQNYNEISPHTDCHEKDKQ